MRKNLLQTKRSKNMHAEPSFFDQSRSTKVEIFLQKQELCIDDNIFSQLLPFWPEIYAKCAYMNDYEFLKLNDHNIDYTNLLAIGKIIEIELTLENDKA